MTESIVAMTPTVPPITCAIRWAVVSPQGRMTATTTTRRKFVRNGSRERGGQILTMATRIAGPTTQATLVTPIYSTEPAELSVAAEKSLEHLRTRNPNPANAAHCNQPRPGDPAPQVSTL